MPITIYNPDTIDFDRPGKTLYEVVFHKDSTWGYAPVPLCVINGTRAGQAKHNVAAFGGTHGNEYEGQVAVWRLMHELDPAEVAGRVILMPRLNQPACVAGQRESPLDNVNMNRAFPGDPRGSITYRIAHFVTTKILPQVGVVLDIHAAGGAGTRFPICASFHRVKDQKQFDEMAYVAGLFDTPFILIYSSEMARGLLTDEAEAMGKITIGGEFGFSAGIDHQGMQHVYHGIKNVLRHYGLLEGEIVRVAPERPHPPRLVSAIHLSDYIPAPITGYFEPVLKLGDWAEQGQLVGRLHNFEDMDSAPIAVTAPRSGYILLQAFRAPTTKGTTMLVMAQAVENSV